MKTDHRYLMVQVILAFQVGKATRTITVPTFYLDMHQLGITMIDSFTPTSQEQINKIVQSIINPLNNEFLTISSIATMVCHSEFQPVTPTHNE